MNHKEQISERLDEVMDRLASASRRMQAMMSQDFSQPSARKVEKLQRRIYVLSLGYAMLRRELFKPAA